MLGFTSTGTIEATQPSLMLAIAFGLSMDYEVFLLSRIRERYDQTGDNTDAVATGLQRTGGIITSAAVLLVIVIGGFSTSGISFIKLIGVGMIIAILVDATVVRALLVPATMRLMGDVNWWAPRPLRWVYSRFGIREGEIATTTTALGTGLHLAPEPAVIRGRHRAGQQRGMGAHRRTPALQANSPAGVAAGPASVVPQTDSPWLCLDSPRRFRPTQAAARRTELLVLRVDAFRRNGAAQCTRRIRRHLRHIPRDPPARKKLRQRRSGVVA